MDLAHGIQEGVGRIAGEGLDHHVAGRQVGGRRLRPVDDVDAQALLARLFRVQPGLDAGEGPQVVDPQARPPARNLGQPAGQAPAHADVAVVVDDPAEDVGPHRAS